VTDPPGSSTGWPLVTVDVDGTLTTVHGWGVIAEALGKGSQFLRTQRRFYAKEIDEDEHLTDLLRVVEGADLTTVEAALSVTPRIRGIAEGVDAFHDRGTRVALLTHNPPYVCAWYCRTFGFDDFEGVSCQEVDQGVIQAPHVVRTDKPAGLRALASRYGTLPSRVLHIGDGWADAALFPLVGRGVALNSSLPDVERQADLALRLTDFREVVEAVASLRPRS